MKFRYQARTKEGEPQVGFVAAPNRATAINILTGHDLFILSLEAAEKITWGERLVSFLKRVTLNEMAIFTRQLAMMLQAHLPLNDALTTLYAQTTNEILKSALADIIEAVNAGLAFSQALERHPEVFSDFFVSMVRAAEVAGALDEVAGFLADYYEREAILAMKVKTALIYPAVIVSLFIVVAGLLVGLVFPTIGPILSEAGVKLPIYTRILIGVGNFTSKWWPALIVILAILILMIIEYFRSAEGKAFWDELKIRLPIIKRVYLPLTLSRFSNAATMLLRGGLPLTQTLEITSHTVENDSYRDSIHEIVESVRRGSPLSSAMGDHPRYFPPPIPQMIAVGEKTGRLDQMFLKLAQFYSQETDRVTNNLIELIQPVLMIVIGVMVAFLFASILIPLYSLTAVF